MTEGTGQTRSGPSRRSLVGAAGAVLAAVVVTGGLSHTPPAARHGADGRRGRPARLRFGSFNIRGGRGAADELDLERVARRIEAMDCDVLGLQEVDRFHERSESVDQPAWLAKRLKRHFAYGANETRRQDGRDREYGTAVLSRWPIDEAHNTPLPGSDGRERRGLLRVRLSAPGGKLTFAGTHLTHEDAEERLEQVEAIVGLLGAKPRRTVVVGDFNARPGSDPIAAVTRRLTDAWPAAGRGAGHSYPATGPRKRIDYIFASADLEPVAARLDRGDPPASDHLPLVAEFRI